MSFVSIEGHGSSDSGSLFGGGVLRTMPIVDAVLDPEDTLDARPSTCFIETMIYSYQVGPLQGEFIFLNLRPLRRGSCDAAGTLY